VTNYVILTPVESPRVCYLWEAIQWRAFGSYPNGYWNMDGKEVRDYPEGDDYFSPTIPDDNRDLTYLTERQTAMAGLSPDPSSANAENDTHYFELSHYDQMIEIVSNPKSDDPDVRKELADQAIAYRQEREEAIEFSSAYKQWRQTHDAYIDQFQTELLIALRRGEIVAYGRKLPDRQQSRCIKIFEKKNFGRRILRNQQ
jgi:hypothetical protein